MNSKRIGVSYLLLILIQLLLGVGISIYYMMPGAKELNITASLILAQLMNVGPVFLIILIGKRDRSEKIFSDVLGFKRIKISTVLMTILYTFLLMPLSTTANAISMLFVDNTVGSVAGEILDMPFVIMFFLMAIMAPLCEELVFRGAFFRGFRKSGNIFGAILMSALLFAVMHLNFNQAAYAMILGIMMALAAEATGSTTTSFIIHMVFNGQSVCIMYLSEWLEPSLLEKEMEISANYTTSELMLLISICLFLAVICTPVAFCVLAWMASNEGKQNFLRTVWASRKNRQNKLWSVCLVIGLAVAFIYMLAIEIVPRILY